MPMTPEQHGKIAAFVDAHHAGQVAFLREIVRVPSDTPPGDNAPAAAKAAELLERLGHTVERHPVPEAFLRDYGMKSVVNLIVRHRFGTGGPTIALNAHGDVVPPGEGWTKPPYEGVVENGRMVARGVAVSKSDIASYTYALEALKAMARDGARLDGTVELHFTYDEEAGGAIGPAWLLARGVSRPDYVISAGFSYGITTAHNGCLHLEVEVVGRSGHAAEPEKGVDALEAATGILSDLYALRRTYAATKSAIPGIASPTLVVGLIAGGINTNVVPDHVKFRLDRRIIPEEDPEQVEAALIASIEAFARKWPGIGVCVRRVLLAVPFVPVTGQEKLVAALSRHGRDVLGEELPTHGVPIYTDARLYTTAGVPAVLYGAGPRTLVEANGHRADERLVLADLHRATEVVARALVDLLAAR